MISWDFGIWSNANSSIFFPTGTSLKEKKPRQEEGVCTIKGTSAQSWLETRKSSVGMTNSNVIFVGARLKLIFFLLSGNLYFSKSNNIFKIMPRMSSWPVDRRSYDFWLMYGSNSGQLEVQWLERSFPKLYELEVEKKREKEWRRCLPTYLQITPHFSTEPARERKRKINFVLWFLK